MKIKCPFWDDCFVEGEMTPAALFGHLSSEHTLGEIKHAYWELIIKIHEKIKCFQSEIKDNHFEDCDSGHDFETHQNMVFAIEELKSLLEDNQK